MYISICIYTIYNITSLKNVFYIECITKLIFSAGIIFRRHNLASTDVRLWRQKMVLALERLRYKVYLQHKKGYISLNLKLYWWRWSWNSGRDMQTGQRISAYCLFEHGKICFWNILYKPQRPKGYFQFEIILNVLVSSFRFIWIPMLWVYGYFTV